jgi:hypothetical protein
LILSRKLVKKIHSYPSGLPAVAASADLKIKSETVSIKDKMIIEEQ